MDSGSRQKLDLHVSSVIHSLHDMKSPNLKKKYLFIAVLYLRCCTNYSLVVVRGLLIAWLLLLENVGSGARGFW